MSISVVPGGVISSKPLLTKDDLERLGRWVLDTARQSGQDVDTQVRSWFEREAIRIGKIPPGFPRELLHRYIFGNYQTLTLSPAEFLDKVGPLANVYDPNKATGGDNFANALEFDLLDKVVAPDALAMKKTFRARYEVGAFHGAHSTAGLGRMRMNVDVEVTGRSLTDWSLTGTAIMHPEKWDFDWEWSTLMSDLVDRGISFDKTDLHGRERRTFLGSWLPGQRFYVCMSGPVKIAQSAGDEWATFWI